MFTETVYRQFVSVSPQGTSLPQMYTALALSSVGVYKFDVILTVHRR